MTDYLYAWRNGWRWVTWFLRHRNLIGALRQAWLAYVHGYIGETCERCGRRYFLWHADDALWTVVTGHVQHEPPQLAAGLMCPACFDAKAQRLGIDLRWRPDLDAPQEENVAAFSFALGVSASEMSGWRPELISRFFGGIAQAVAVARQARDDPAP